MHSGGVWFFNLRCLLSKACFFHLKRTSLSSVVNLLGRCSNLAKGEIVLTTTCRAGLGGARGHSVLGRNASEEQDEQV